jgi:hypothetical protein
MNTHHLVLGTLTDFLTGEEIADTHDERYRQKIARFLVTEKGYLKPDITGGNRLTVGASGKKAVIPVDFLVSVAGRAMMLVKYGPGSIITRHRPAVAAARVAAPHQIPVVVVTNGEEADILCGRSGKVTGSGFPAIPRREELLAAAGTEPETVCDKRKELEYRILYAFEVDGSCPCDSDIFRIEEP